MKCHGRRQFIRLASDESLFQSAAGASQTVASAAFRIVARRGVNKHLAPPDGGPLAVEIRYFQQNGRAQGPR
jgi:hypothetical protein